MNASRSDEYVTIYPRIDRTLPRDTCPIFLAFVLSLVCVVAWTKADQLDSNYFGLLFFVAIFLWAVFTLLYFICCKSPAYEDVDVSDTTSSQSARNEIGFLATFISSRTRNYQSNAQELRELSSGAPKNDKPPDYNKLEFSPVVKIHSDSSGSSASSGGLPPAYVPTTLDVSLRP